jgi:hypothetical protein
MKIKSNNRLFWFLKDGTNIDLSDQGQLDMYIQQAITRGRAADVKALLKQIDRSTFFESFQRIKHFLPLEVAKFWEDYFGHNK